MNATPPDALLLIAPGCPHCQAVLNNLAELVKAGTIGRLEVVNIAAHPEAAQEAGVRSVPWTRIGNFALAGEYTRGELEEWTRKAAAGGQDADYIRELLEQQQLDQAIAHVKEHPESLPALLELMKDPDQSLAVRFGLGAIFEALAGSEALHELIGPLTELARSDQANLRADAAHYLGLSGNRAAVPVLRELLDDDNPDVREIAADALEALGETP